MLAAILRLRNCLYARPARTYIPHLMFCFAPPTMFFGCLCVLVLRGMPPRPSLGGNTKTVMCANAGPAEYNYDETVSTLR